MTFFQTSDYVVSTETWSDRGDPDLCNWDEDFEEVIKEYGRRHSVRGRSSGGISFCAKKKLARDYKILSSDPFRIWLKINKSKYNREEDIVCILHCLTKPQYSSLSNDDKSVEFT